MPHLATPCVWPPAPAPAPAPGESVTIVGEGEEAPCTIVYSPTGVELRATLDGSRPDPGPFVRRDRLGRYITTTVNPPQLVVWSEEGEVLTTVGREGEGPGEFLRRGALVTWVGGDSIYVRDGSFQVSVFDRDLRFVRRLPNLLEGLPDDTHILDDGRILMTSQRPQWQRPGSYFSVFDRDGHVELAFGLVEDGVADGPRGGRLSRVSAYAGGDRFWAAPDPGLRRGVELELWTVGGQKLRTLRREASWFPSGGIDDPEDRSRPPPPRIGYLHVDDEGLLWVVSLLPKPTWRPDATDQLQLRVEVLDPDAGVVLASDVIDDGARGFTSGFFPATRSGYRAIQDDLGLRTILIYDYHLVRK